METPLETQVLHRPLELKSENWAILRHSTSKGVERLWACSTSQWFRHCAQRFATRTSPCRPLENCLEPKRTARSCATKRWLRDGQPTTVRRCRRLPAFSLSLIHI